jgi:4-carboxymuconolactone decarboxylase
LDSPGHVSRLSIPAHTLDSTRNNPMTLPAPTVPTLPLVDPATRLLVRLAAVITGRPEAELRPVLVAAREGVPAVWVEELILQSYLFAGFPRALNAAREWRRVSGASAPATDPGADYASAEQWRAQGEETCAIVYGDHYDRLRENIRALHPSLDAWMIVEGYGKVLSRPGLDVPRRELCIIAACAIAGQDRQLHSHLRGALNAGASRGDVDAALDAIADLLRHDDARRVRMLWARVAGK